jgi:hypothetical protein
MTITQEPAPPAETYPVSPANLRDPDAIAGRARNLQQALRDGINVRYILAGAAEGAHLRDSSGYWYDRRDPEVTRLADLD